jgi:hypothetical protein
VDVRRSTTHMVVFEHLFRESKGKPVAYQGRLLQLMDRFPVGPDAIITLTFESTASANRQGVRLDTKGHFIVDGRSVGRKMVLWSDTAPAEVSIHVRGVSSDVEVYNVWDHGDGVIHAGHNGAAMVVEEIVEGRRYRCNDGEPDDDLDDLVFAITKAV